MEERSFDFAVNKRTPAQCHQGRDKAILAQRKAVYEEARRRHPRRWANRIRNWDPIQAVWLNPDRQELGWPPTAAQKAAYPGANYLDTQR